jgi:hypothetical protein
MELAFGKAAKGASLVLCLCSKCANRRRENKVNMSKHLLRNGFTPDYTRWVHHDEAYCMREEVVRARLEDFDDAARVGGMLNDYAEAKFGEESREEEQEATTKAFYDMMSLAQKRLHGHTTVSKLDAIGHVMAFKS